MAGRQRVYKVDVTEVEKEIAVSLVTNQKEKVDGLKTAMKVLNIPLSDSNIAELKADFEAIAKLLKENKK